MNKNISHIALMLITALCLIMCAHYISKNRNLKKSIERDYILKSEFEGLKKSNEGLKKELFDIGVYLRQSKNVIFERDKKVRNNKTKSDAEITRIYSLNDAQLDSLLSRLENSNR